MRGSALSRFLLLSLLCALACGKSAATRTKTGLTRVPGPTEPTRYIWRVGSRATAGGSHAARIEWIRVKLSPGKAGAGYRFVLGICAKRYGQPRPFCGGGGCDARSCPLQRGGGDSFSYHFLGPTSPANTTQVTKAKTRPRRVPPYMEIRWRGKLKLRRPGPGQATIELPAYNFRKGIRLRVEN